jgi:hypothetical protein
MNSKDLPLSRPLPDREWCRGRDSNPYATFVAADFKSAASAIPPPRPEQTTKPFLGLRADESSPFCQHSAHIVSLGLRS